MVQPYLATISRSLSAKSIIKSKLHYTKVENFHVWFNQTDSINSIYLQTFLWWIPNWMIFHYTHILWVPNLMFLSRTGSFLLFERLIVIFWSFHAPVSRISQLRIPPDVTQYVNLIHIFSIFILVSKSFPCGELLRRSSHSEFSISTLKIKETGRR